jgi:hypothetical protein
LLRQLQKQAADLLLSVTVNKKTLDRQIRSQFQGKRKMRFGARDHEIGHGRYISWTLRAPAAGFRIAVEAPEHITESWIGSNSIVEVTPSSTRGT